MTENQSLTELKSEHGVMNSQILDANDMYDRNKFVSPSPGQAHWFSGLKNLPAFFREVAEICAKLDRELPAEEARADRLMRQYGI